MILSDNVSTGPRCRPGLGRGFALPPKQRRRKRTQPPPKENLLENFSGLKEKLSRPVVDTKTLKKTRRTISTTEIFPLWTPFFSAKRSSALEQGGVWFLFAPETLKTAEVSSKSWERTLLFPWFKRDLILVEPFARPNWRVSRPHWPLNFSRRIC